MPRATAGQAVAQPGGARSSKIRAAGRSRGLPKQPDAVDEEVGRRIRVERLHKGMTQTELGNAIGVTFQQVQKYEKGGNRVGAGRLTRIAEALEIPLGRLIGDTSDAANGKDSAAALMAEPYASSF